MREKPIHAAVRQLRGLVADPPDADTSDAELLQRFADGRDETAFAALVRRHGSMVREVCRRLLGQASDVEDASQVVFLVLARKANSVRRRQSLAGWLYGIAYRTALRVRRDAARRKGREGRAAAPTPSDPVREAIHRELCAVLDAELFRLAEDQRSALVLCYLEGRTREEAARQLGQSVRTLDRLLQRGRELLRLRLARRGVTLSAAFLSLGLSQDFARATAARIAAGVSHEVSPEVIALMRGVLRSMMRTRIQIVSALLLTLALMGTAAGVLAFRAPARDAVARSQPPSAAAAKAAPEPEVYALLLIKDDEPRLLPDARRAAPVKEDASAYRRTQAVLLKSRSISRAALKREEVKHLAVVKGKADPEGWLARHIKTSFLDNTGVMRVSFGEGSPEDRAVLINALVEAFMNDVVVAEQRAKESRVADLDKVLDSSVDRLRRKEASLLAMAGKGEGGDRDFQRQEGLENLTLLRKELLRVRLEKAATQARLKHRKDGEGGGEKAALAKLGEEAAALAAQEELLKKDIASLKDQVERMTREESNGRERLRSIQEEIASEKQFHADLARRVKISLVELQAPPRVRILQKAEVPSKREN